MTLSVATRAEEVHYTALWESLRSSSWGGTPTICSGAGLGYFMCRPVLSPFLGDFVVVEVLVVAAIAAIVSVNKRVVAKVLAASRSARLHKNTASSESYRQKLMIWFQRLVRASVCS